MKDRVAQSSRLSERAVSVTALGLYVRATGPGGSFERTFDRPPVFFGRNPSSDCVLDSPGVSKTHVCMDVRPGIVCVRDCGSANGTIIAGERIEPHRWRRADGPVEVRVSGWILQASAVALAAPVAPPPTATLRDLFPAARSVQTRDLAQAGKGETVVMTAPDRSSVAPAELERLDKLYAEFVQLLAPLREGFERALVTVPAEQRRSVADLLAARYPSAVCPPLAALLLANGWTAPAPDPLASTALRQTHELARWYLGSERTIGTDAELVAFKEHQRRALDELILGFVRVTGGLDKFESELALRGANRRAPSPEELVRDLLDWNRSSDAALQRVREGFAELMMHQVALLHGVMRGVKALLDELAPSAIETFARSRSKRFFWRPDFWAAYKERFADFTDEEGERFRVLFGAEFAEEYRAHAPEQGPVEPVPGTGQTVPLGK